MKRPARIYGLWVRSIRVDGRALVQVLTETKGGLWRLVSEWPAEQFIDGVVSHIVEPLVIDRAAAAGPDPGSLKLPAPPPPSLLPNYVGPLKPVRKGGE